MTRGLDDPASQHGNDGVRPHFFVGLGTAKSGTTWIAQYLASHPQVTIPPTKELHFFDSIYVDVQRDSIRRSKRTIRVLAAILRRSKMSPLALIRILRSYFGMRKYDETAYRRFLEMIGRGGLVGEFTPAYAMLPEAGFTAIERTLDQPHYIIIFRNPADRFYAQMRMAGLDADPRNLRNPEALLSDPHFDRCNFKETLNRLYSVVEPTRVLVMFYEDLFDPEGSIRECERLCNFLGIEFVHGRAEVRVNAGRSRKGVSWNRPAIVKALGAEYIYFAETFGGSLPENWRRDLDTLG